MLQECLQCQDLVDRMPSATDSSRGDGGRDRVRRHAVATTTVGANGARSGRASRASTARDPSTSTARTSACRSVVATHEERAILGGDFNVFDGFDTGPVITNLE